MRIVCLSILCFVLTFKVGAQQHFIGNENGQWTILSKGKKVKLPLSYHSLSNFDMAGFASYGEKGKYGIIDSNGEIVEHCKYNSIEQLGGGFYNCITDSGRVVIEFGASDPKAVPYDELNKLENTWYELVSEDNFWLINTPSQKWIFMDSSMFVINNNLGYVKVLDSDSSRVFDPNGSELDLTGGEIIFNKDHLQVFLSEGNKVVYADHEIELPSKIDYLNVKKEEIIYTANGRTTIVDPSDGRVVLSISCDNLSRVSSSIFIFTKGLKSGLVKFDGTVICPAIYNSINKQGKYYSVLNSKGRGLMNSSGDLIVPCKFSSIRSKANFFEVTTRLGTKGVYSQLTKKEFLSPNYDKIAISSDRIRGWITDNLVLIEYDSLHNITSKLVLQNTISKYRLASNKSTQSIDERLYTIGWFDETTPIYDKDGFQSGERVKWGIRDANDSLLCKPKHSTPDYIPLAGFSTVYRGKEKFSHAGGRFDHVRSQSVIDITTGKFLFYESLFSVDTTDLFTRNYSRFISSKGFGYITGDNKVRYVQHMDGGDTEFVRFCTSKTRQIIGLDKKNKNDPEGVGIRIINLNDDPYKTVSYSDGRKTFSKVKFPESKWNFLDTNGQVVFDRYFEFAEPFHRKTSIFKNDGKWGVLNSDTIIIPNIYNSVKRLSKVSDTIFKVKRFPQGLRYLDTLAKDLKIPITRFLKSKTHYAVVQTGRTKKVIDENYNILSDNGKSYKLLGNECYFAREGKEYMIYSKEGDNIGASKLKPTAIYFDEYVLVKSKGRYGLLDFSGDTLIPFNYKSIEQKGELIYAYNKSTNSVFNNSLELIRNCKDKEVLFDELNNFFAISNGDKVAVYDENNEKLAKFSNIIPTLFRNGVLIQTGKDSRHESVFNSSNDLPDKIVKIEQLGDYGYLVWIHSDTSYYYTADWNKAKFESFRRVKYLGEGYVTTKTSDGTLIWSLEYSKVFKNKPTIKGKFSNGFLLLKEFNNVYYVNQQLNNAFNREFADATSFSEGYATIKEQKGWTIIDTKGHAKSVSTFDKIIPKGQNIFETRKQPLYGLYDSHGSIIIPVEYEQINVLYGKVIQTIKNTEINYFDLFGNPIDLK